MARAKKIEAKKMDRVQVELPMAEPRGYQGRGVNMTFRGKDVERLARLVQGARDKGLVLRKGKPVDSATGLFRWIVEHVELGDA